MKETYTFPSELLREEFKRSLSNSGVTYVMEETEEITEFRHRYFLHITRTSKTLKQRLTNG